MSRQREYLALPFLAGKQLASNQYPKLFSEADDKRTIMTKVIPGIRCYTYPLKCENRHLKKIEQLHKEMAGGRGLETKW